MIYYIMYMRVVFCRNVYSNAVSKKMVVWMVALYYKFCTPQWLSRTGYQNFLSIWDLMLRSLTWTALTVSLFSNNKGFLFLSAFLDLCKYCYCYSLLSHSCGAKFKTNNILEITWILPKLFIHTLKM